MKEIDCALVEQHDLVGEYLAERLDPQQAEAFEAHYFGCERCSAEVQVASELRAAVGGTALVASPAGVAPPRRLAGEDLATLLAAAAAVAIVVVGLREPPKKPAIETVPESQVLRGETADSVDLRVSLGADGQVLLRWTPQLEAQTYRIDVLRTDGIRVFRTETPESRLELSTSTLPAPPPGISFLVRIEALNMAGQTVARSEPTALVVH